MPVDRTLAAQAVETFLRALGRDPAREPELLGTAARVAEAWADELVDGYDVDVPGLLAGESSPIVGAPPGLVVLRDVAISTMCPHHLLPARGTASVAYLPGARLAGIGTLAKVVDAFAHRLTLQETIGTDVTLALVSHLGARGAGCRITLTHSCLASRGERQPGASVQTISLAGALETPGADRELAVASLGVGGMSAAVVTGASRGIGRATALALAARGLDVALWARSAGDLDAVAREVRALGVRAQPIVCDVTSEPDVTRAASEVLAAFGAPQVVVNNAGIILRGAVHEQSLADFRAVLDVNLTATFLVTRALLPAMLLARSGRLIQIASISSTLGSPRAAAYCASKWGVVGFTKSLAEELRGTGLATMSVLPGSVDTAMLEGSGFSPDMTPAEVARTVVFASLDSPDAMNGSSIEMFG